MRTLGLALGSLFAVTMMIACGSSTNDTDRSITTQDLPDVANGAGASRQRSTTLKLR